MNTGFGAMQRKSWFVLVLVLFAALTAEATPRFLAAQEAKTAGAAEGRDNGPAQPPDAAKTTDEKPAQPPDAAKTTDEKPAQPPDAAKTTGPDERRTEAFLHWVVRCSGFIGLVILLLSVYFVSTVARLFWAMRIEIAAPPEVVLQCEGLLEQRNFKEIYELVKEDDSFFSRLLTTGISELPSGLAEARDAMERVGDAIAAEMEKRISMLAVIGTLGPMIGLLGTLKGMIASFSVIARSDVQLKASEVAGGISEALLLTFEGVALSVPAIYFFALFRNRIIYIASSVMLTADQFLRHFSHAGRAKPSAPSPPAMPKK